MDDLTSTRRTSLRGSRFDDDDTGYSSFRRTSRTSSRGDDDDLGLTSYRRRTSGLSEDDDSLSFRRTKISSSYELEDTGHSYKSRQLKSTLESASDSAYSSYLKYGKTSHETATEEAVEAKPGDIFVAVLDYDPPKSDTEGIPLKEGQEVECLDTSKPRRWQVKTRPCSVSQEISEGWVPSCYLEKKADASESITDPKFQEAKTKREAVVKQLVESEEDFARDMQFVVNNYIKEMEGLNMPKELRDQKDLVFSNFKEISEFHNNVLIKGVQYYASEPAKLGKTFLRLERDFDKHVTYCRDEPFAQEALASGSLKDYFSDFSKKINDDKSLSDHLKLPIQRINDYQLLLKEILKFTAKLNEETEDLEKAFDFMQAIPQRIADLKYLNSLHGYKGNIHKLGRILRKEWFEVTDENNITKEKFVFLFKKHIFVTDERKVTDDKSLYIVKNIIKIKEIDIQEDVEGDSKKLTIKSKKGDVLMNFKAKSSEQKQEWIKEFQTKAVNQVVEDLSEDEFQLIQEEAIEPEIKKAKLTEESKLKSMDIDDDKMQQSETDAKVEILEDFEAYEEMNTAITESLRSGSLTSLEDFQSALEDEPSLCITASETDGTSAKPLFTKPLHGITCTLTESATFECQVATTSPTSVMWLKDNMPVTTSDHFVITSDDIKHCLCIKNVVGEDAGLYTVVVTNAHGTNSSSATLCVISGKEVDRPTSPGGSKLPYAPVFKEKLMNSQLIENTNARFTITVDGVPEPTVTFYKNETELKQDNRIKIISTIKGVYELIMDAVTSSDAGKYSCVAINSEGQDVTIGNITVTSAELPRDHEAPVLVGKLADVEVNEGASAMLELKATGYPKPKITWFKGKEELTVGERYRFLFEGSDSYTLVIKKVQKNDSGEYSAILKNDLGEINCKCHLTVKSSPVFRKPMKDMAVMTDEPVKFEVEVEGNPTPEIKWFKDGQQILQNEHVKMFHEAELYALLIEKTKPEDSGNYSCVASNSSGNQTGFGALTVNSPAKFIQKIKSVESVENETISFNIKIAGNPKPTIKWMKNDHELKIDNKHIKMIEEENNSYLLTIDHITKDDAGKYSCKITNEYGSDITDGNLNIAGKPSFIQKLSDIEAFENDDIEFKVKISGEPKPKIKWFIDSMEITENANYKFTENKDAGEFTLKIKSVNNSLSGKYTCEASNSVGKESSSGTLSVKESTECPSFVHGLEDMAAKSGEDVKFTVKLKGKPKPTLKWIKDSAELTIDNKKVKVIEEASDSYTLILKGVNHNDSGTYSCEISNKAGKDISSGKLTVKTPAKFIQGLKDIEVAEDVSASFTVKVDGNPKPNIKWNKDDAELTIDGVHIKQIEEESVTFTLIIDKVTKKDIGKYSCEISNEYGKDISKCQLGVAAKPTFKQKLVDKESVEGETNIEFLVEVDGSPTPTVKWFIGDVEITSNEKYSITNDSTFFKLTLKKVTSDMSGNYRCKATNSHGSSETSATFTVYVKPKIIEGLKDLEVKEGETVNMTVKISGLPAPDVKWKKNGEDISAEATIKIKQDVPNCSTIIFDKITTVMTGEYECIISNKVGEASTKGNIIVKSAGDTQPPVITQKLTDQEILVGDAVRMEVKIIGKPTPEVTWLLNDKEISSDSRIRIDSVLSDNYYSLTIKNVTLEDEGNYVCKAVNEKGEASTSATLTVEEPTEPTITGMKNLEVTLSSPGKFEVEITGIPTPEIQWLKDGKPLHESSNIAISGDDGKGHFSVIIRNIKEENVGTYKCIASNSAGKAEVEGKLSIKDEPPKFLKEIGDREAKKGDTIIYEVRLSGYPLPEVIWLKQNVPLTASDHYKISHKDDIFKLEIHGLNIDDIGTYTCKAKNSSGEISCKGALHLIEVPPTVQKILPGTLSIKEGEILKLEAKFDGEPKPDIKWMKDGNELKPSDRIKIENKPDGSTKLIINQPNLNDAGNYSVLASNNKGKADSQSKVNVEPKVKKSKPNFIKNLENIECKEKEKVTFQAKVSGEPKPDVTWFKDGKKIEYSERIFPKIEENGQIQLFINDITVDDIGEYKAVAVNEIGDASSVAKLSVISVSQLKEEAPVSEVAVPKKSESDVTSPPVVSTPTVAEVESVKEPEISTKVSPKSGKAPEFNAYLKPAQFTEGESGQLIAKITGDPLPKVTWLKNGKPIVPSDHIKLSENPDGSISLSIDKVTPEDAGKYAVVISNEAGEEKSEAPVAIIPISKKMEKPQPKFKIIEGLQPVMIPEGQSARLQIKVSGEGKPSVSWKKDGKDILPNEHIKLIEESGGIYALILDKAVPTDAGKYTAIVLHNNEEEKSEALMTVVPKVDIPSIGKKPEFLQNLQPKQVTLQESLLLQAKVIGEPKPSIKWLKDGEEIRPSSNITMIEEPDGTISLKIDSMDYLDAGKYVAVATNIEGKTRNAAAVEVLAPIKKKPEFLTDLQPVTCNDGESATFKAKIAGEPKPKIKWMKDGNEIKPTGVIKQTEEPDGTASLHFTKVTPKDAGKYTLAIANDEGETRSSAPLTVNQPPVFTKPLLPMTAITGFPGKLEAKVNGVPRPTVEWLKNGQPFLTDGEHVKLYEPDGTVAILFEKCKPDHAGKYSCIAKNSFGECTASGELSVIEKESDKELEAPPAFLSQLYDVSAKENESIKFEATVSGNPFPDVHWFLDEQPILPSNNIHPLFDGKKVSLEIKKCNPQHAGNYECHLINRAGNAISKAKAKVTGFSAPKFIQKLVDMEAPTTDPTRLTCRVSGFPEPDIEWYRNGDLLYPGIKYSMSREGDQCHLNIPYPRGRDSGTFECHAKNIVGEDKCSAKIQISDTAEHGEAPIFLKKLINIEALEGSAAKFTACVTGIPKPLVKWFKNGEQLEASKHYTMEHEHNGILRLIIYQVKPSDIGEYRVSISNKYGSDTCTARLHLAGVDEYIPSVTGEADGEKLRKTAPPGPLPDPPFIMRMTDNYLTLGWRPSIPTFPRVPVTYEVEMCQEPDGNWTSYKSGLKDSVCDIRGLVPNQDYRFRIRVENKHGISDPSPYITAYRSKLRPPTPADYKPKDYEIEHPPLDKHAAAPRFLRQEEEIMYGIRGQPVRIEFWVYGHPQPEISWLFNGVQVDPGKYDFLQDRNGQVILFITRMTENDIGSYVCHATNEHGEARQKIKVLIAESPIFTRKLEETSIMMRGGGKFECCVTGVPTPKIKWFKDWHPIYESSRIKIQWTEPDKCNLSLDGAILKDSGLYSCCASNVAGSASTSASLSVEEFQSDYNYHNYNIDNVVKPRNKIFEDFYDIGDELGRGTQGIIHHAVERDSGRSFAAKMMHGTDKIRCFMDSEVDIMNQLSHPRLVRLWDAFETKSSLTLITDLCGGGELLNNITHREKLTESDIAHYIKQLLEGLEHMHSKFIGHLGLTIGDLLITRVNSDNLKICDFGLATRLNPGREYIQLYGHPEFVAPEIANKQPVSLSSDMWSVGIITYLLLTGSSPFLGENDRETLKNVQQGKVNFFHDNFVVLSDEAKDFVSKLLVFDPSGRIDVKTALKHPWLRYADVPDKCDELNNLSHLRDYYKKWRDWYSNASCRRFYRRRPLDSCFTHPSRMIYPSDIEYTPTSTPDRQLAHSHVKPAAFDDVTFQQKIVREPIDFRSESQYQNGPDTFLLPLHDKEFPIRLRQYLRLGAKRSPSLAEHLKQKHWGDSEITVKERRRFVDVMDKEISDEKRGLVHSMPLRLQKEVGSLGTEVGRKRSIQNAETSPPYFREKIRDVVIREDEDAIFKCFAVAKPAPLYSWFRNDGILIQSSRIEMKQSKDGHCELRLKPGKAYDVGLYKCVARNTYGVATCRARLKIGDVPGHPEPPIVQQCSDTELYVVWNPPKNNGNSPVLCYSLEYKKSDEDQWKKAAKNISHEFFVLRELSPSSTYYLRLAAKNRFGWGDYSQLSEPFNTLTPGSPKIKISKARKYQQEMTERGQELFLDDLEATNLDYSLEDNPIELVEGDPLELYNFVSEVARGRFSVTVKVWVKQKNTTLMAKVMQKTPQTESNILHEFDILRSLKHERIVSLEMASTNPTSTILILEKLSGMDILTYFSCRHQYTEEMVAKVVTQVLDALEYLHFRGICYLELQPDNVVLTDQHHLDIKLVDFGSAQCIPPEGARVNIRGSLEYLAPEILKQEDASTASDLWSVGVLTYILLSGVSPFHGENDVETTSNVLYVRYHFDNLYKEVTQEATRFLMQLFKRTPQKRPTIEECFENKWLIPSEFMIRKREHAVFLTHRIHEFSEQFHAQKRLSSPPALLNMFGMSISRSVSLETEALEEF